MRDSSFLALSSPHESDEKIVALIKCEDQNFGALVDAAGLDPTTDFRHVDLSNVNFDNSDLRGFDFTGSCLTGALGTNVRWDHTTILVDADLEGSMFVPIIPVSPILPEAFFRQHWAEMVMWIDKFRSQPGMEREDAQTLQEILIRANDPLVRQTAMKLLNKLVGAHNMLAVLTRHILDEGERSLVGPAFQMLGNLYDEIPGEVTKVAVGLLPGPLAAEASILLATKLPAGRPLRSMIELVSRHESAVVRRRFIAAVGAREGEPFSFILKDPNSEEIFDFQSMISEKSLNMLVNALRRRLFAAKAMAFDRGRLVVAGEYNDAVLAAYHAKYSLDVKRNIIRNFLKLNDLGFRFWFEHPIKAVRLRFELDQSVGL